jgi:hypothetical protein
MDDCVNIMAGYQRAHEGVVVDASFVEGVPAGGKAARAARKIVEADNRFSGVEQGRDDMSANEAG